jgi:hypothetical protein
MFGGEPVVHRDDDDVELIGDPAAEAAVLYLLASGPFLSRLGETYSPTLFPGVVSYQRLYGAAIDPILPGRAAGSDGR